MKYRPSAGEGVIVVGKLNFWASRASLSVQVLDVRPSLSTVLRQFQVVRELFIQEGLIDEARRRKLPSYPRKIAILTSVPSSALADILRTAKERWPKTNLVVIPIPVQGNVANEIRQVLIALSKSVNVMGIEAIVLARGGGSREDLMVFDDEDLCRELAGFPIPLITGLGHEDDWTVADLVADYRAATPTAALVALLPSRDVAKTELLQRRKRLEDHRGWFVRNERDRLKERTRILQDYAPYIFLKRQRILLNQKHQLLQALSPANWLNRGFAILRNDFGKSIRSIQEVKQNDSINIELIDGEIYAQVIKLKSSRV